MITSMATRARAQRVVDMWAAADARGEPYRLARRAYDDCFEAGDGDRVVDILAMWISTDPDLAALILRYPVNRYAPEAVKAVASLACEAEATIQIERVRLRGDDVVDQALVAGVEPVSLAARDIQALRARKAARRACAALPAGGLFDDVARAQLELF